ncbi:MAG: glycosyltransferase [Bacteroidales bacterium]|jgi:glycosyltransferase involved in cell wall biosynthesis|nr:glycosyltransferase [Bacteroidales bacterium]
MPKVSIIIPVYNVEKYLRECLDSVVNQTLRDIEIICVNDGSSDGSPQILEEYAAKDSRITVIHKENGGLSSARNAAFPYIKSQYTLFVDSDDWIELDLCEKTVTIADKEQADMALFFYRYIPEVKYSYPLENFLKRNSFTTIDQMTLLDHMMTWSKLWKTQFLRDNNIKFPEGICFEDNVVHWNALLQNPKLAVVPEQFYWYRVRSDSITMNYQDKKFFDIIFCYKKIKEILLQEGKYEGEWKKLYLKRKLNETFGKYYCISHHHKPEMLELIKQTFNDDEREFLATSNSLPYIVREFYRTLDGSGKAALNYTILLTFSKIKRVIKTQFNSLNQVFRRAG